MFEFFSIWEKNSVIIILSLSINGLSFPFITVIFFFLTGHFENIK